MMRSFWTACQTTLFWKPSRMLHITSSALRGSSVLFWCPAVCRNAVKVPTWMLLLGKICGKCPLGCPLWSNVPLRYEHVTSFSASQNLHVVPFFFFFFLSPQPLKHPEFASTYYFLLLTWPPSPSYVKLMLEGKQEFYVDLPAKCNCIRYFWAQGRQTFKEEKGTGAHNLLPRKVKQHGWCPTICFFFVWSIRDLTTIATGVSIVCFEHYAKCLVVQ